MKCDHCKRKLHQGLDVFCLVPGVIGTRGFIPFDQEQHFFCSQSCLDAYVLGTPQNDERIP